MAVTGSRFAAFLAAGAATAFTSLAQAGQDDVVLLPTVVPIGAPEEVPELRRPEPEDETPLAQWARKLDAIITEAVQDLGLQLDVSNRITLGPRTLSEDALIERAADAWVISPRLEASGDRLRVRIVAVAPGSRVLLVRSQELQTREVAIRALVMTRDVVQAGRHAPDEGLPDHPARPEQEPKRFATHARSQGRAVLALNAAAFGGYVGFTLQHASGSDDDRLTYPLIALGTGIGLGGSMIVADEWDVGLGDAWFLSAGAWWPGAAGYLLADGYDVDPEEDRHIYALLGVATGVTLATTALTFKGMGEGGATLTHSGGAFGLLLGGLTQIAVDGDTDTTPTLGMGYGAGIGVVAAGITATQLQVNGSRVLLVDLGAGLGGLGGAAAASPLVFGDERTDAKNRIWVGSVAAGVVAGGTIGYLMTEPKRTASEFRPPFLPYGGVIGASATRTGSTPVYGGGVEGEW
jgi:hypothetical protein